MIRLLPTPTTTPRKIFIMAGQSNMQGHGALGDVPAFEYAYRCFIYRYNEAWSVGYEPMADHTGIVYSTFYDDEDLASSGMPFANRLAELLSGFEIGLVPCTKGGSGMPSWARDLDTGTHYGAMVARAQAAAAAGELAGLIWYQGEEDSKTSADANAWASRFEQFISDVRSDLAISELPVVYTKLGPDPDVPERPYWDAVWDQQEAVSLTNAAMVDASDLTTIPDNVHLDTPSLVTLGGRYAAAMDALFA